MDRQNTNLIPAAVCAIMVIFIISWPADAPWSGDDVILISTAIKANSEHRLITAGLGGSFGYPYGPIPSQIYQVLAIFSHDPIVLVRLHAGLFATVTSFALLWLSNVLNVSPWLAPLAMLGPFFWFYCRLMWDNTFAIPIGTLLLGAYGDYVKRRSSIAFFTAVICGIALPLIHPMTLPLVMAVSVHAVLASFIARAGRPVLLKKHWIGLVVIVVGTAILSGPYIKRVGLQMRESHRLIAPRSDALSRPDALAFPLFSGRLFCAYGFFDARGPEIGWEQNHFIAMARVVSLLAYPLIWVGMMIAICRSRKQAPILVICLGAMVLQSLLDAALRISPYPHYFCGTWAAAVVLLWQGIDAIPHRTLKICVAGIYAASLLCTTAAFAIDIHQHAGGTVWYGPSLGVQMQNHQ